LQADTKVGSGAAGAGAANDFVPGTQGDGGSGSAGQMLGALSDGADGGLKIEFAGADINFFSRMYGAKSGDGMGGVGDAKLAAKGGGRNTRVMVCDIHDRWIGDCAQQIAYEAVEFGIGDEVGCLLVTQ
jgi:hypothetical protein